MFYTRKQRREFAKKLGLLGQPESLKKKLARWERTGAMGEQLHAQFLAEAEAETRRKAQAAAEPEEPVFEKVPRLASLPNVDSFLELPPEK